MLRKWSLVTLGFAAWLSAPVVMADALLVSVNLGGSGSSSLLGGRRRQSGAGQLPD